MKRKRLFSALMALAMLMSLSVSALADNIAALGAGSEANGYLEVGTLGNVSWTSGDPLTVPDDFAQATLVYTTTYSGGALPVTLGNFSVAGWTAAIKSGDTLDLLQPGSAVIQFTNSGDTLELTVTPDVSAVLAANPSSITGGTITLGQAGEFRPAVAANSDGQLNSYTQDRVNGDVTNEGPLPPDVINVKVPTAAQTKDAFDLYLDPHDLIATTNASRYGSGITVTSGGRLYFKTNSGGAISMASSSAPLTIVNKSNVKVSVDLSVEATKAVGSGGAFTFKDTAADVDSATGAAIYLALKSGTKEEHVSDTATNGKNTALIETSIDTGNWYELAWHGSKDVGYYSYDMKSTLSGAGDSSFESISFNLTGKINDDDAWDDISSFGLSVIWDVKAYQPPAVKPTATVETPLSGPGSTLTLNMNWGTLTSAKAKADLMFGTTVKKTFNSSDGATVNYVDTSTNAYGFNQVPATASVIFYNSSPTEADAVTVSNLAIK